MRTIWKFPLAVADIQRLIMPKGAEILTVQRQGEQACLWVNVDDDRDTEVRVIEIHRTGNPMGDGPAASRRYIGTFQAPPFVWHVFEALL